MLIENVLKYLNESVPNPDKHDVQFTNLKAPIGDQSVYPFIFKIYNLNYYGEVKLKESAKGFTANISFKEDSKTTKSYIELYSDFIKSELKKELLKIFQNAKFIII